jgi:hypothetical protein
VPYNDGHGIRIFTCVEYKISTRTKMKQLLFKRSKAVGPVVQNVQKALPSLGMCLVMDILGCVFVMIPLIGPVIEMLFAPISAIIYLRMFGVRRGLFGGIFNFVEELIPGLDFIPTFTITWFVRYANQKKENTVTILKPFMR